MGNNPGRNTPLNRTDDTRLRKRPLDQFKRTARLRHLHRFHRGHISLPFLEALSRTKNDGVILHTKDERILPIIISRWRAFPNSKAQLTGFQATHQLMRLALFASKYKEEAP
jgi:hypothetical protein